MSKFSVRSCKRLALGCQLHLFVTTQGCIDMWKKVLEKQIPENDRDVSHQGPRVEKVVLIRVCSWDPAEAPTS